MKTQKRLTHSNDLSIIGYSPLTETDIAERDKEYNDLSNIEFKKKYRKFLFAPAYMDINDSIFEI